MKRKPIQWGSEYHTSLVFKWSVVQMPFEYRTKFRLVFRPPLNIGSVFIWWSEYQITI